MKYDGTILDGMLTLNDEVFQLVQQTQKYNDLLGEADISVRKLNEMLNEKQKEELAHFEDIQFDLEAEASDQYFRAGFKLGLRLAAECFLL